MHNNLTPPAGRQGWRLSALALAAGLGACGGGGGGGDTSTSPLPIPPAATPQLVSRALESSSFAVQTFKADIDDSGQVTVVLAQSDGARTALVAASATPGAAGQVPGMGALQVVDSAALPLAATGNYQMAVAPNGNAVVVWEVSAPCSASTYRTTENCTYVHSARRLSGGNWEAPVLVGDTPGTVTGALINNRGDVAVTWPGWVRAGSTVSPQNGVAWRAVGDAGFRQQLFAEVDRPDGTSATLALDSNGNLLLVTPTRAGGLSSVVAYRGTVAAGFGAQEDIDNVATEATLEGLWSSVNGQAVVLWRQQQAGSTVRMAAAIDSATGTWQRSSLGAPTAVSLAGRSQGAITDAGNFSLYDLQNCTVTRRSGGQWQASQAVASGACPSAATYTPVFNRSDKLMAVVSATGQWAAYNGSANTMTQSLGSLPADLLWGVPAPVEGRLLLAENGVGAFVSLNRYDTLPSAASPSGVLGAVNNLWLTYIKLP